MLSHFDNAQHKLLCRLAYRKRNLDYRFNPDYALELCDEP